MLASFGPLVFSLATIPYQDNQRNSQYRWPVMDRLGVRPARQWIGVGDETLTLRGTVYALLETGNGVVGTGQIDQVRQLAEMGTPYDFIDGSGKVWGRFVITDVRETGKLHFQDGQPRKQEFEIDLGRYGEDDLANQGMIILAGDPVSPRTGVGTGIDGNTGAGDATA
jgi:hypothetical protein